MFEKCFVHEINKMILLNLLLTLSLAITCYGTEESSRNLTDKVLSRKKRFLIFPEGSSFQLVFCLTYPALIAVGDIFLWGTTAALAFDLPQDPYSPFNHKADPLHRRMDTKHIYYMDEDGKILYKQPYKRKPLVNPAFAKRSLFTVDKKKMHLSRERPGFKNMDDNNIDFHRSSRTQLYDKIEVMLDGLGENGRACLLKTICLYRETAGAPQGGFLHEIIRTIFTLPKSQVGDFYNEFDEPISSGGCADLYPECSAPVE